MECGESPVIEDGPGPRLCEARPLQTCYLCLLADADLFGEDRRVRFTEAIPGRGNGSFGIQRDDEIRHIRDIIIHTQTDTVLQRSSAGYPHTRLSHHYIGFSRRFRFIFFGVADWPGGLWETRPGLLPGRTFCTALDILQLHALQQNYRALEPARSTGRVLSPNVNDLILFQLLSFLPLSGCVRLSVKTGVFLLLTPFVRAHVFIRSTKLLNRRCFGTSHLHKPCRLEGSFPLFACISLELGVLRGRVCPAMCGYRCWVLLCFCSACAFCTMSTNDTLALHTTTETTRSLRHITYKHGTTWNRVVLACTQCIGICVKRLTTVSLEQNCTKRR